MTAFFCIKGIVFFNIFGIFYCSKPKIMKRLNKEYKLDVSNYVLLKYGSVNKDNPQVVYVSGKCWVSPTKETDYDSVISKVESEMRKNIRNVFVDGINFENRFILDFDISTDGLFPNRKKFLSFDFYLRQTERNKKKLADLKQLLGSKVREISSEMVLAFNENAFIVEKRK